MQQQLFDLVRQIPSGKCINYGALGALLDQPVSGKIVGRWMASCPDDVPWWRVVAINGALPVGKRDPNMGLTQRQLLEDEGVPFLEDLVDLPHCRWDV